jgi:hypothetical protein
MDDEIRLFTSEALALEWKAVLEAKRSYDRIEVWRQMVLDTLPECDA